MRGQRVVGAGRPRLGAGQPGQPRLDVARVAQRLHPVGDVARFLAKPERALLLVGGLVGEQLRAADRGRLDLGEFGLALTEQSPARAECCDRAFGIVAQLCLAIEILAQASGARGDHGQRVGEQQPDMDDVLDRSGLRDHQRGRAARQRLQRGDEMEDRPLLVGDARALGLLERADQRDPRLRRGDIGQRSLDLHLQRLGVGARARGLATGLLGLLVEGCGMRLGIGGRLFGADQRRALILDAFGMDRRQRRGGEREDGDEREQGDGPPPPVRTERSRNAYFVRAACRMSFDVAQDERG